MASKRPGRPRKRRTIGVHRPRIGVRRSKTFAALVGRAKAGGIRYRSRGDIYRALGFSYTVAFAHEKSIFIDLGYPAGEAELLAKESLERFGIKQT